MKMKKRIIKDLILGITLIIMFGVFTLLVMKYDIKNIGVNNTTIGFATLNSWFNKTTGTHLMLYSITDWLELLPLLVCVCFGLIGLKQLLSRKKIFLVDHDILLLGIYYIIVILLYLLFDKMCINYRPILIEGKLEVSYPSSTVLLVLCVMLTLTFQINRRVKNDKTKIYLETLNNIYIIFMLFGRIVSGVHWITDIIGSIILALGLFKLYISFVNMLDNKKG